MITTKLHGNAIPESEIRARILRALAILALDGVMPTFATMRGAGMRGHDAHLRRTIEQMRAEGEIPAHVLPALQNQVTDPIHEISARDAKPARREVEDSETEARERSREWVSEHDARMRRIRRKARGEFHTKTQRRKAEG